jgi:hypothetical protein
MIAAQGQPPLHAAPVPAHPLQQHQEAYGGEFASAFHQSQQQQQSSAPLPPISAGEGWTQRLNQDCKENRSAGRLTTAINERPQTVSTGVVLALYWRCSPRCSHRSAAIQTDVAAET